MGYFRFLLEKCLTIKFYYLYKHARLTQCLSSELFFVYIEIKYNTSITTACLTTTEQQRRGGTHLSNFYNFIDTHNMIKITNYFIYCLFNFIFIIISLVLFDLIMSYNFLYIYIKNIFNNFLSFTKQVYIIYY